MKQAADLRRYQGNSKKTRSSNPCQVPVAVISHEDMAAVVQIAT